MSNERATADRERLLLLERANRERAARFMTDRVMQQERLIQSNQRALQNLEHNSSIVPQAMRDGAYALSMAQSQRPVVQTHADEGTNAKKRIKMEKQPLSKLDDRWLAGYNSMRRYKEEYGDCFVPRGFTLDPRLGVWAAEQRKQYKLHRDGKNSSITPMRIELLNEIGFSWATRQYRIPPSRKRRTTKP